MSQAAPHPGPRVALESTLLAHGVPRESAVGLARELESIVRAEGCEPVLAGVRQGRAFIGLPESDLAAFLTAADRKLNTPSLGAAMALGHTGATTVSTTIEVAAAAGVRVFATGGLGGVHRGYGSRLDVSTDLAALARWPVAVVASGCKGLLDVAATRELLEALGVPVVGWRTDRFPAFYQRQGGDGAGVDARFDDMATLAKFIRTELSRSCRGVLVCNPIDAANEIPAAQFAQWLAEAERRAAARTGRDVTPAVLAGLHEISGGATLAANIALVKSNARVAAGLARHMGRV